MNQFDVLIVGAGPAGSFAAERLALGGRRVALFDGRPAGFPKACGGGVTSKALKAWPHLLEAVGRTVTDLEMYSPGGRRLPLKLDEPFAIYSRNTFDTFLLERARAAGAHVVSEKVSPRNLVRGEDSWTIRTASGSAFHGNWLAAADGANSSLAKKFTGPLPPAEMEVAFGYRAPFPEDNSAPTVVAFLPGWVGYAWAFPRLDHISFGIATSQDAFDHDALDGLLWDFMIAYYRERKKSKAGSKNGRKPVRLWSTGKAADETNIDASIRQDLKKTVDRYAARIPGLLPRTWDTRRASGEGWALLGDAAGFADPVTGEGIYYALRSAELFADAYLAGRAADYEQLWRKDFGRELQRAAEMRRRFYGNFWGAPFTERMIEFARGHRGIRKVLGELVAGDQGYVNLKRKLARRALWPL
jgi:flavin-dependent dehydrogenase